MVSRWIKIERSRLIGPFRETFGPRNSGGIVAVRFHLTVRLAHKWGASPNVSGRSSPPVSNLLTRVRLALKGLSPTNLTHLARAALLSLSGWWASFHWVVSYLRLSLSPVPSPLPRSWSFAWRLPCASLSTGALPI